MITIEEFENNIKENIIIQKEQKQVRKLVIFYNKLFTDYKPYFDVASKYLLKNKDIFKITFMLPNKLKQDIFLTIEFIKSMNEKYVLYKSYIGFDIKENCIFAHCIVIDTSSSKEKWEIKVFEPRYEKEEMIWNGITSYLIKQNNDEIYDYIINELYKACIETEKENK